MLHLSYNWRMKKSRITLITLCLVGVFIFAVPEKTSAACFEYYPEWYVDNKNSTIKLYKNNSENVITISNESPSNIFSKIPLRSTCFNSQQNINTHYTPDYLIFGSEFLRLNSDDRTLGFFNDIDFIDPNFSNESSGSIRANIYGIIDYIDNHGKITVRGDSGPNFTPRYIDVTIPMTNCVHMEGDGQIRVVFLRGNTLRLSTYLQLVDSVIKDGFKGLSPFKQNINKFSFLQILGPLTRANLPAYHILIFRIHTN